MAGLADNADVEAAIERYNYAYGVQLVQEGFVVFCPDARGFGELQLPSPSGRPRPPLEGSCQWLNHMALPLGQTVTGMWVWDLMRLVDYILDQRPECDGSRLGMAGLSGGGLQTLWTAALDERVTAAVVSGYFYGNGPQGLANVVAQVEITRRSYARLGAEANLRHHVFPGGHRWCGEQAIPSLKAVLGG